MTALLNETHDPELQSWVSSANEPEADFPIQNLPFAACGHGRFGVEPRICVAIGSYVLDVAACAASFDGEARCAADACAGGTLNSLMTLGPRHWSALRLALSRALTRGAPIQQSMEPHLLPQDEVSLGLAVSVRNFTDFFASIHHARNAGSLFRPDEPLLENYKYVPIAYCGRPSSLRRGGQPVKRPWGQVKFADHPPRYEPTRQLDWEAEMAIYVGSASESDIPVSVARAEEHVFGFGLLNDWSARDIQAWEYRPLGPFLGKSFATSVSPWVVTAEAILPYRVPAARRDPDDPQPLPHLFDADDLARGGIDLKIRTSLRTRAMKLAGLPAYLVSETNTSNALYWTVAQMIAHYTSNGSCLDVGDLLGSGTLSGPTRQNLGSLMEITRGGRDPIQLPSGEIRSFVEDGDEVTLSAFCQTSGGPRIGFGVCSCEVAA